MNHSQATKRRPLATVLFCHTLLIAVPINNITRKGSLICSRNTLYVSYSVKYIQWIVLYCTLYKMYMYFLWGQSPGRSFLLLILQCFLSLQQMLLMWKQMTFTGYSTSRYWWFCYNPILSGWLHTYYIILHTHFNILRTGHFHRI